MDSSTKGAINEYLVAIDLIKRGFEVYRNVSATGATDMVATHTTKDLRVTTVFVQVKSRSGVTSIRERSLNDVLAIVSVEGKILYKTTPGLTYLFKDSLLADGLFSDTDSFRVIERTDDPKRDSKRPAVDRITKHDGRFLDQYRININGYEGLLDIILRDYNGKVMNKMTFKPPDWMHINTFGTIVGDTSKDIIDAYRSVPELEELFSRFPEFVKIKIAEWRKKNEEGLDTSAVLEEAARFNTR